MGRSAFNESDIEAFSAHCVRETNKYAPAVYEGWRAVAEDRIEIIVMVLGSGDRVGFSASLDDIDVWIMGQTLDMPES